MPDIEEKFPSSGDKFTASPLMTWHMDFILAPKNRPQAHRKFLTSILPDRINVAEKAFLKLQNGDQSMALVALYRATFGDILGFDAACEHCDFRDEFDVDLTGTDVKRLTEEERKAEHVFRDLIHWHHVTIEEQLDVIADIEEQNEQGDGSQAYDVVFNLAASADEIVGVTDLPEADGSPIGEASKLHAIRSWFMKADVGLTTDFSDHVDERSCGPDLTAPITCRKCNGKFEVPVPVMESFFTRGRRLKKLRKQKIIPCRVQFETKSDSFSLTTPSLLA